MALPATYNVITYTARGEARLLEHPFDTSPSGDHEIIGKTVVSLVSTGSERGGLMDYFGGNAYPMTTGYCAIIEAVEVGAKVENIKPGELYWADIPHQDWSRKPDYDIIPLPKDSDPKQVIFGRFMGVSLASVLTTVIQPGETALVTGLGLVGLMCAQTTPHFGYEVYCIEPDAARREFAKSCGVERVYASAEELANIKGKIGLALECTGTEEGTYAAMSLTRRGGEVVLVGVPWRKTTDTTAHDVFKNIFYSFLSVRGGWEWMLPKDATEYEKHENYKVFARAFDLINEGKIHTEGIYELADPKDCNRIYNEIGSYALKTVCVMFDWSNM